MTVIWAALPILVILVLMLGFSWSAARAGLAGAVVAIAVAIGVFEFPATSVHSLSLAKGLTGVTTESLFTALVILWIIGPALGIYELQTRTGSADVLRASLARFAPNPTFMALLVAWFFAIFMEGAAGFGASVALAAPFLVAAGFQPTAAVVVSLVGHVVGVSFGAVGTPVIPQVTATGLSALELARNTGIYHSLLGWMPLAVLIMMVRRNGPTNTSNLSLWGWASIALACFVVPFTGFWWWVGPELPTLAGALVGGAAFILLLWVFKHRASEAPRSNDEDTGRGVLSAAAPYLILVALVLLTRLIPPLKQMLQRVEFHWELWDTYAGSIQPLYHPGTMLLIGFVAGGLVQGISLKALAHAAWGATRALLPVSVALAAMLFLSRMMVHANMTDVLAASAAQTAGRFWPALAPFVGALGTFVTGSATASNILFTQLQSETATALGLSRASIVGAQGFGAAVGNLICPHNIVAASATVGLVGQEGVILRRTVWVAIGYATLGAMLGLWILPWFSPLLASQ